MDTTELGAIAGALAALASILGLSGAWLRALARVRTLAAQVRTVIQAIEEVAGRDKISGGQVKAAVRKHMTARGLEEGFRERVHEVTESEPLYPARRPASRVRSPRDTAALLLAAVLCIGASACRTLSDQDVALIITARKVNAAHAQDMTLPPEARAIATDAHDVLSVLEYSATGRDIPADVRARLHESEATR